MRDGHTPPLAFVSCAVLAGGNAVCVRLSNRELDPLWGAALRFLAAAGLLWILVAVRRRPFLHGSALTGAVVYGLLNFAAAFALAYNGLLRAPAGTAGVLLALVPLLTLALAAIHHQERIHASGIAGGVLAIAGVAIISAETISSSVPFTSVFMLIGSAACFAEATVIARRFPQSDPIAANAVGMTAAATALLLGSALAGDSMALPNDAQTWSALLYLVPMGTVAVFVLFLVVVSRWPASRAAYIDVLIPITTAFAAAWILDEPIGLELALGGTLILIGVVVGALRPVRSACLPPDPHPSVAAVRLSFASRSPRTAASDPELL